MHKTLISLATHLFYTSCIHHFICPFRGQPPVNLDLLSFSLIECNSIPYYFLLKTHILLFFSNHELYFTSSFYTLVRIHHPKLCHLQKYIHNVSVNQINKQTSISCINSIMIIYQFTQALHSFTLILLNLELFDLKALTSLQAN